jgi:hypothetical protein
MKIFILTIYTLLIFSYVSAQSTLTGDGNIDVSTGSVTISEGSYTIGSQTYTYKGKVFTLTGKTTANSVTISGGADTVKLNSINIRLSSGCAFNINTGANITVVVNKGTIDTLVSGSSYAGLQKSQTNGMLTLNLKGSLVVTGGSTAAGFGSAYRKDFSNLTIEGKGTLVATGGSGAAGIGSGAYANCSNITIREATIDAMSASQASGIGGGRSSLKYHGGGASNITIESGNITATSTSLGYSIGGSFSNDTLSKNITISGGIVNTNSGNSYNVENYLLAPHTTITGGTINGKITKGITGSLMGRSVVITGGTLNLLDINGSCAIATASHPTNGTTSYYLYRSQFKVPGITSVTQVSAITINDTTKWGCNEVFTNDSGMVYIWLPQNATTNDVTKVQITVGDKTYTYSGYIDNYDEIVEASSGVSARGNYFYQVPVSISGSHANLTVADADKNAVTNGSFVSSGQFDDNKTRLTIAATADEGYKEATFTYTNLEVGSKYYKVTAVANDTVKITATANIKSFPVTFQSVHGAVAVVASDTSVLSDEWLNYGTSVRISTTPDDHYQFDSLLVNGVKVTDGAATITSATTITAYFSLVKFSVSIVGENGSIVVLAGETSISSGYAVDFGTILSISATPNTGYRLDSMMVNGRKVTENAYTLTDNITVSAIFSKISTATAILTENTTLVYASGRTIYVEAATGSNFSIYSVTGQLIASGMNGNSLQSFVLPSGGLYLVKVSNAGRVKTTKCLVR